MTIFYSATTNGFYPESDKALYEQVGGWPDDCVEVSERFHSYLINNQGNGKVIMPNEYGLPVLIDYVVDPVVVAEETKRQLLSEAAEKIAILQDAVDLNLATEDEKNQLIEWKKMRVLLARIKTGDAPNIEWPSKPE
ncbi:tail fiber assembly protein [Enterobacter sichuanensis]|uniref:Tail fiber assembly protein n=1 Tax=Enterobacter sichuanensis TaxID=2071710 RepID=A0AAE4DY38_9ENTR|nr:tail fiber assembly protein [Enterobacter sichuanensis]MDR9947270.1 tail fiber assembly protein [Enterobacter sichuanensis]